MQKIAWALALLAATSHGQASDLLDSVQARGALRIAMEGGYPPFNFFDAKQQLGGFEVDFAKELTRRLKLKPEFLTGKWTRLLADLQAGKFDVVIDQVEITPPREQQFDFSQPYTLRSPQLVVRRNERRMFRTLEDLKGKTLGVGRAGSLADLAKTVSGIQVKSYPGAAEYLHDLGAGKLDAVLGDSLTIPFAILQSGQPVKAGAPVGTTERMGIAFAKGNPRFKAVLDQAIQAMKADGSFRKISLKWFGSDVSPPPVR